MFHHFAVRGGFNWETDTVSVPHFWYNFITMGGNVGSDIFVLITGYFMIRSKQTTLSIRGSVKFYSQVLFYSLLLYAVFRITGIGEEGTPSLKEALLPITYSSWWFVSVYFVLYLLHPILNRLLNSLDKKTINPC